MPLLSENANLDVVLLLVDVDGEVLELVDQLVYVLGIDLAHVKVHPLLAKRLVDALLSDGRNETREPHAGAKQRDRHPHVDVDGLALAALPGINHDPDELGQCLGLNGSRGSGRAGGRGLSTQSADEAIGLFSVDLARGQHLQDLPALFCHLISSSSRMASSGVISPRRSRSRISTRDGRGLVSTKSRLSPIRLSRALMVG